MPLSNAAPPHGISRARVWSVAALVGLTAAVAVMVWVGSHSGPAEVPAASAAPIQGPRSAPVRLHTGSGAPLTCPTGSTPTVNIVDARFRPELAGGTHFRGGVTYRVLLRGAVVNETTEPIAIDEVVTRDASTRWRTQRHGPDRLAANSRGAIVIRGTYRSARRLQVHLEARLHWHWQAARLRPCGERGLVEDD